MVVPVAGLEPAWKIRRILSAVRLPIPPHRRGVLAMRTCRVAAQNIFIIAARAPKVKPLPAGYGTSLF